MAAVAAAVAAAAKPVIVVATRDHPTHPTPPPARAAIPSIAPSESAPARRAVRGAGRRVSRSAGVGRVAITCGRR